MEQGSSRVKQQVITVVAKSPVALEVAAASERALYLEKAREIARTISQKLQRVQKNIVELKQVSVLLGQKFVF